MRETPEDLARLQALLDDTYARAGAHLASIHTPEARLTASELVERLPWMQVFVVATASQDGRPFTGPVDTFLHRGWFWFGTAADAVRARHLAVNPGVSATHVRGEALVVTVHGSARRQALRDHPDFVAHLRQHYGGGYDDLGIDVNPYYRIEPTRLYAADMSVHQAATAG